MALDVLTYVCRFFLPTPGYTYFTLWFKVSVWGKPPQ